MTRQMSFSKTMSAADDGAGGSNALALVARSAVVLIGCTCLVVLSVFFDRRLASEALELPPWAVQFAGRISDLGESGYMFAIVALVILGCFAARRWLRQTRYASALTALIERALYIFAILAVSGLLAQLVKHMVGRARPKLMQTFGPYHFDFLSMKSSLASFPSGHAATAFAMATALGLILPRGRVPLFVLASLIAVSRVMVEAHYVSDIVAGATLGVLSALAVTRLFAAWDLAFEVGEDGPRLKARGVVADTLARRSEVA